MRSTWCEKEKKIVKIRKIPVARTREKRAGGSSYNDRSINFREYGLSLLRSRETLQAVTVEPSVVTTPNLARPTAKLVELPGCFSTLKCFKSTPNCTNSQW